MWVDGTWWPSRRWEGEERDRGVGRLCGCLRRLCSRARGRLVRVGRLVSVRVRVRALALAWGRVRVGRRRCGCLQWCRCSGDGRRWWLGMYRWLSSRVKALLVLVLVGEKGSKTFRTIGKTMCKDGY